MGENDKSVIEELNRVVVQRQNDLNKAKTYLSKVNQQRDPQTYKDGEEEIKHRQEELYQANEDMIRLQDLIFEIEDLEVEKLENEKKQKEKLFNKVEQQLSMINKQKDPQTYRDGLEEFKARKKELDEINDKLTNAEKELKKLQDEKLNILTKYKIKSNEKTKKVRGSNSQNIDDKQKIINDLENQIKQKKDRIKAIKNSFGPGFANQTEQGNIEIKKLRKDIKDLESKIEFIKNNDKTKINQKDNKLSNQSKKKIEYKDSLLLENNGRATNALREWNTEEKKELENKDVLLLENDNNKSKIHTDHLPIIHPDVSIEKTGLQVFREQFNKMPEIKGRHALSENPFLKLPVAIIPAVATIGITGGVAAVPVMIGVGACVATYAVSKPIIKKITGQGKIENQIQKQFEDLIRDNPEEFDKMAHYLTEENIVALKPHCTILNALVKASQTRCNNEIKNIINPQLKDVTDTINKLSERKIENLTNKEKEELIQANKTREDLEKQKQNLLKNAQEIKDGTKSKSADIKGNMKGSKHLNLFARRNHTTKEYKGVLNDYADTERAADEEKAFADYERAQGNIEVADKREAQAAIFRKFQHDIMKNNSYAKGGVHRSIFNGSKDGSTIQAISRIPDETIKHIGIAATTTAGLFRVITNMNKLIEEASQNAVEAQEINNNNVDKTQKQVDNILKNLNLSDEDTRSAARADAANIANSDEMTGIHAAGTVSADNVEYHGYDEYANVSASQNKSNIDRKDLSNMNFGEKLRFLANWKRNAGEAVQRTADSMKNMELRTEIDHTDQGVLMNDAQNGNSIQADIMEKMADVYDKLKNFNSGEKVSANVTQVVSKIQMDFLGPAATALGSVISIVSDSKKINKEIKWNNKNREATGER